MSAATATALREWGGLVASRLRLLPGLLERPHWPALTAELIPGEWIPPQGWVTERRAAADRVGLGDEDDAATEDENVTEWTWSRTKGPSKRPRVDIPHTSLYYVGLSWAGHAAGSVDCDGALAEFAEVLRNGPPPPSGASGPRARIIGREQLPTWLLSAEAVLQQGRNGDPRAAAAPRRDRAGSSEPSSAP